MSFRALSASRTTSLKAATAFQPVRPIASRASLLFGTALGVSIAILAAAPNQAWAADECGADVAGVVICTATSGTGNPYPGGITYVADAGEDITVVAVGGGPLTAVDITSAVDGIFATNGNAGFDTVIDIEAGVSITAVQDGATAIAANGDAYIYNAGDIEGGARGLFAYGGAVGTAYISNSGSIDMDGSVFAAGYVHGIIANGVASSDIVNSGDVTVAGGAGDNFVTGIWAYQATAASVESSGAINVTASNGGSMTIGIAANASTIATVTTTTGGTINVTNTGTGNATGISVLAGSSAYVTVGDDISVESVGGDAFGVNVTGGAIVDVSVTGDIYSDVDDYTENNYGILATSTGFSTDVTVVGDITISDGLNATGIDAAGVANVVVDVTGNIQVGDIAGTTDTFDATGIEATSSSYAVTVNVVGDIDAYGATTATGIYADGNFGAFIDVEGDVYANATTGDATGIQVGFSFGPGFVTVDGDVTADAGDDAMGIVAMGYYGAFVTVTGDVTADGGDTATGVYALGQLGAAASVTGNVTVDANSGAATGVRVNAAGAVAITVTGDVSVESTGSSAVGLSASSGSSATVTLTGDLYSDVDNPFMSNTGIFVSAASANVDVIGDITISDGGLATGIDAFGQYGVTVDVTGDIQVGDYSGSIYTFIATGIGAGSTYVDAIVTLTGDATAYGYIDGTAVRVISAFEGVTLTGSGSLTAVGTLDDAFGAYLSAGSGDTATMDFVGDVSATAGDAAVGIMAGGTAVDITLDGDIVATGASAWGVQAFGDGGDIYINVGDVTADSSFAGGYTLTSGAGIEANTSADVTIIAGDILTYGDSVEGISIQHQSGYGDPDANAVDITVGSIETNGDYAEGMFVDASAAVTIGVTGAVDTAGDSSNGITAISDGGYIEIDVVDITTGGNFSGGVVAQATTGVNVTVTGTITTQGTTSSGVNATTVNGDAFVSVVDVETFGNFSDGVSSSSINGDAYATASGEIYTGGYLSRGIAAFSAYGDADVVSSADLETIGGRSTALWAYAVNGDASITSTGDITTNGNYAHGISAGSSAGDAYAYSSGVIITQGDDAFGMAADTNGGDATLVNTGGVYTYGEGSHGLYAYTLGGVATVDNADGHVETDGDLAYGIYAYGYAGVNISNGTQTVITSGDSAVGIFGFSFDGYVLINSGNVVTTGDLSDGIVGISLGLDLADDYVTINSGTVSTDGLGSDGIVAYTYNGQITIDSGTITTLGDDSYGIFAYANNDGSIDIVSDFIDTSGANAWGIYAYAFLGTSTVDSFDVDTDGDNSIGIYNYGFTGAYLESSFVQTDGAFSAGIVNLANYGLSTVDSYDVETRGDDSVGIFSSGFDGSDVDSTFVRTYGDRSDGIVSVSTGGSLASVNSLSVFTDGDYSDGVVAVGQGYYDSFVGQAYAGSAYVSSGFVQTNGYNAYGIYAAAGGGDVNVYSFSVQTNGDFSTGIYAAAFNYYDSGLLLNLQGDVYVGSTSVFTNGDFSPGIDTYAEGGNIEIVSSGVQTTGDFSDGIRAFAAYYLDPVLLTYYSGDVSIDANIVTTFGDFSDGVDAYAAGGDVTVFANNISTFGLGSDAIYAGTGGFDAGNSDDVEVYVYGDIYAFDGRAIAVDSAGSSYVYVGASAEVYGYSWGIQSNSGAGTTIINNGDIYGGEGRAIDVDGASAYIDNNDYILGFIDLTDNADHVENDGVWETYGTSSFGAGVDDVDNDAFLGFSRYTGAAATTTFTGLEFFDNAGLVSALDQQVNDQLTMAGATFTGTGASEFEFDVDLAGPGSLADRLVIGSAAGSTLLTPNDLLAGQPGVLNLGGILIVDSANPAEVGNEFNMANIDKGWVEYELFFDAANDNWLIVGLPDDEVFELLGAMSGAQDFWRRSGDALSARWQEMRDASPTSGAAGPGGMGRSDGWELWMQAHAGDEGFDSVQTFDIGGFSFTQDLSIDSDWRGFQFGFDNLTGNTMWGLTMGFNQQENRFELDGNSFDTEGWNLGAYAGWNRDGFFLNGLVKGSFYEVDGNFRTLPLLFSFDGVTWGVKGEAGYRWEGEQMFFEPIVSLAWTTTELDGFSAAGASVDFDAADSLRGKAGARIGGTFGTGDVVLTPYIGVYAVEEFEGENSLNFTSGPTTINFGDGPPGNYGLVDFGVTAQTFYGLEAFVKGEWNFGSDADGGAVRLGARWRW